MEISIKISKGVDLRTFNDLFTPLPTETQGGIVYLDIRVGIFSRLSVDYCFLQKSGFQ